MSGTSRKYLFGISLLLLGGGVIGWIYGSVERGLLVAALLALVWQIRHLLAFVTALRTRNFDLFRDGDGIWQQIYSQFDYVNRRASRYKKRHRKLLKEVRKSTDAMPDGAVILNADNEIVMCNRAAKSLAGLKPNKDRGQRVDNILRDPELTRLLKSDDFTKDIEIPSPVGSKRWLRCQLVPYGEQQKLLFMRDITDKVMMSKMRRDFVANASHELRSPLTVISGYLDGLIDDGDAPDHWVKPLAQMQSQAQRMNTIVAELLELSRLESAGSANLDGVVDMLETINSARTRFSQDAGFPTVEVSIESDAKLRGNPSEIDSILTNLLSNAIRHVSENGHVVISWSVDGAGGILAVEDDGEGIEAEHLPRLTERFFRVDRGRSRNEGGIGLGLAIVKHIMGRHDGRLDIVSEPGQGSRFSCHFPAQRLIR